MNPLPQPQPHPDPGAPVPHPAGPAAIPAGLADGQRSAPPPPPHRLWEELESAYAAPAATPSIVDDRLGLYKALPLALGVSLALWAGIIELVVRR